MECFSGESREYGGQVQASLGVYNFISISNRTELNYGWYCEKIKDCESAIGDGSIVSVSVNSPLMQGTLSN